MVVNRETRYHIIIFLGCFLLSYLSYFNIINSFFLADDFGWIHRIKTTGPFGVWNSDIDVFFRPIVSLTLFIDYKIWGLNSIGYHLTNINFHAFCAFLCYPILSHLLHQAQFQIQQIKLISISAALLFIILPSHVEAVTWISARSDLVATCFCLASFYFYLSYKNEKQIYKLAFSYLLFFIALLSKESVITYPGIVFAYELYHFLTHKNNRKKLINILFLNPLAYAFLVIFYFVIRYLRLGRIIGGYGTNVHLNFDSYTILRGLGSSLRVLVPSIYQSKEQDWQLSFLILMAALLILMLTYSWVGQFYQKTAKLLLFLITVFLISLVPVINLMVSVQDNQGERFLYFPSVFVVMIFTLTISTILWRYRLILLASITVLILFFSNRLYASNQNWQIASTVSQQILEDINSIAQTDSLFVINVPDQFNGAYIYRNGLYQATQLFCEDKQIQYLPIVLFHHLIDPDDEVEVIALGSNQYHVKLVQSKAYFYHVGIATEQRLETPNFNILEFDWETRQSFTVEVKPPSFQDQVVYYSGGHLLRVSPPL
jgi:hypothetical protein